MTRVTQCQGSPNPFWREQPEVHLQDSDFLYYVIWNSSQQRSLTIGLRECGLIRGWQRVGWTQRGSKVTRTEITIQIGWIQTTKSGVSFGLHPQGKGKSVSQWPAESRYLRGHADGTVKSDQTQRQPGASEHLRGKKIHSRRKNYAHV